MSKLRLPAGKRTIPFDHGGRQRPYLLHLPTQGKTGAGWPLVLELQGRGIDAVRFDAMTGFISPADEKGFVLVASSAVGEIWNDGRDPDATLRGAPDDVGYLTAILDDVAARRRHVERRLDGRPPRLRATRAIRGGLPVKTGGRAGAVELARPPRFVLPLSKGLATCERLSPGSEQPCRRGTRAPGAEGEPPVHRSRAHQVQVRSRSEAG